MPSTKTDVEVPGCQTFAPVSKCTPRSRDEACELAQRQTLGPGWLLFGPAVRCSPTAGGPRGFQITPRSKRPPLSPFVPYLAIWIAQLNSPWLSSGCTRAAPMASLPAPRTGFLDAFPEPRRLHPQARGGQAGAWEKILQRGPADFAGTLPARCPASGASQVLFPDPCPSGASHCPSASVAASRHLPVRLRPCGAQY